MNGVLLRVVNTGVATHSPHWHGNHVFIVQRNGVPERAGYVEERDVVRMEPLYCYDVILPAHTDRKSTRLNSSHANISYAVFCLKKKKRHTSHILRAHFRPQVP